MKRIISLVCVLAMLVACAVIPGYASDETSTPVVIGYQFSNVYQNSNGETVRNIRFVAAGNDVSYNSVGISVSATDYENKEWSGETSQVFETLNAVGSDGAVAKISAKTYGAQYLFAYVVKGVPANEDINFTVQAFAKDADGNNVSENAKQVKVSKDADVPSGPVYPIPADAVDYTIGGEVFTVVRTLQELKNALSVSTPETRVILGCDIDGKGEHLSNAGLEVGTGSVIEGNNYTIAGFTGQSIFNLANGDEIVIRNLQFGTDAAPLKVTGAVMAGYTRCVSRWENVSVYANLTANGGDLGIWYGKANGTHTFVNCSVITVTVDNGSGNTAAWVGNSAEEGNVWTFDGCKIYGSVKGNNNAGGLFGYMVGSVSFENCTNYANITGNSNAGGFIAHVNQQVGAETISFTGCANYGAINGGNVGGFMGQDRINTGFTNCVNYGSVTGSGNAGGMVGMTSTNSSAKLTFTACTNRGSVTSSGNAAGYVGNNQITECVILNSHNFGDITSNTHAGGFISWNAGILTVEHGLNAGSISGRHTAGIAGRPDAGKAVRFTDCANIGAIKQTVGDGSATNIGGYMTGANGEIVNCYGFGKLEQINYPGILVCQYSSVKTASGNKYFEFGNTASATTIALDGSSKLETLEEALALLEARFTDLDFEIANGVIRIASSEGELTAMSFNILVGKMSTERTDRVVAMIQKYMPDTFGVQEADKVWMNALSDKLGSDYAYVGKGRDGNDGEFSAIFYKKSVFNLKESGTKWLSDTPDTVGSKFEDSAFIRIFTYAILERKSDSKQILVINTHLDVQNNEVREKQAKVITAFIKEHSDMPVIVTGDFNNSATAPSILEMQKAGLAVSSQVAQSGSNLNTPTFESGSIIDFILVSKDITVNEYLVDSSEINGAYPSDHRPVVIRYVVK